MRSRPYCELVKQRFPDYFASRRVLDVGSLDVMGTNRYLFSDCDYVGLDVVPGRNVDVVMPCHRYDAPSESFDTIITTECMEPSSQWMATLNNIERLLRSAGLFLFTAAPVLSAWDRFDEMVRWQMDGFRAFVTYQMATNKTTHEVCGWMIKR